MRLGYDWLSNNQSKQETKKLTCPNKSQHRGFKLIEQIGDNLYECECGEIFSLEEIKDG